MYHFTIINNYSHINTHFGAFPAIVSASPRGSRYTPSSLSPSCTLVARHTLFTLWLDFEIHTSADDSLYIEGAKYLTFSPLTPMAPGSPGKPGGPRWPDIPFAPSKPSGPTGP